jgi:signal transduction histidine kinase
MLQQNQDIKIAGVLIGSSRSFRGSKYITIGFIVVLALMVVLIGIGLFRMKAMQSSLDVITKQQNRKTTLLNTMRAGVQRRRMGVSTILLSNDLFEQEDERVNISNYAMQIVNARDALAKMEMSVNERKAFDKVVSAMREAYPLQMSLIDKSLTTKYSKSLEKLRQKAIAAQKRLTGRINDLEGIQHQETEHAVRKADQYYKDTGSVMLTLGVLALLLGAMVMLLVQRITRAQQQLTAKAMQDLKESHDHLERRVADRTADLAVARDDALAASEAKTRFLANMSHELRTPLNAIIGYSELLQEESEGCTYGECDSDLKQIRSAGKHLLSLIDNILDLAKIESGKIEMYYEDFNIRAMVDETIAMVQPLIQKKQNTLQLVCPDDIGRMHADIVKIRQSLFNLLSNASKFTDKGTIVFRVARHKRANQEEWIIFDIQDSGIGLSRDQADKIFLEFTQADSSTTRRYGGTGLGLVISKRFCEIMGGQIDVSSRLGEGSTFTICIPARANIEEKE